MLKTPEELRTALFDRIDSIAGRGVDRKQFAGASLAELEEVVHAAYNSRVKSNNKQPPVLNLAQIRTNMQFDAMLGNNKERSDKSLPALLERQNGLRKSDALRERLYAEASDYYGAPELRRLGLEMADANELNALIVKAKNNGGYPPALPSLRSIRSTPISRRQLVGDVNLGVDEINAQYNQRIGEHRPGTGGQERLRRTRVMRHAGRTVASATVRR